MPWDQRKRLPHSKIEEQVFKPQDSDLKTISLPGSTVITTFGKSLVGASSASEATSLLEVASAWTEYIKPTSQVILSSEMNNSIINNYGQGAVNVIVELPVAAISLSATFVIGTAQAGNIYAIKASTSDKIYLAGTAGSDGGLVYIVPTVGASIKIYTFQTGVGGYDWIAEIRSGTWLEGAVPTRVTTTGDTRVTTAADTRIAA